MCGAHTMHVRKHKLRNKFQVNNHATTKRTWTIANNALCIAQNARKKKNKASSLLFRLQIKCIASEVKVVAIVVRREDATQTHRKIQTGTVQYELIMKAALQTPTWWTNCEFASVSFVRSNSFLSLSLSFAFFSADVSAHFSLLLFYTPGTKLCSHAILTHIILFFRQINYPTNCIYFSVPISFTIFSAPYTIGALALYLSFTHSVSICVLLCVCVCAPLCDKGFLLFCKRFKSPKAMQTL